MTPHDSQLSAQLRLFAIRAAEIFDRVLICKMLIVDAADILYDASIASGLDASVGIDLGRYALAVRRHARGL
jgi:hypothetical protein